MSLLETVFTPPKPTEIPSVIATYRVETRAENLKKVAAQIAVGQTLGTWEGSDGLEPYLARVIALQEEPLPSQGTTLLHVQVAFPFQVIASDIGTLLTVLFGKLSMAGKVRLVDLDFPPQGLSANFPGPRYGIAGIRRMLGIPDRPLVMSIFKPCLGLSPQQLGETFYQQALGGVDWVKDDEILSDTTLDSAQRRLAACLEAANRAERETGRQTRYAINLTGPAHELLERGRSLAKAGAHAFLFNYLSYGLPMLAALRSDPDINIPLVAHPSLAGAFYGSPAHGISPQVLFGHLPRLAGADLVLFPSPYGSVALDHADALQVADALRATAAGLAAFPVPSAGITAEMLPQIVADFGDDVVINAGTGIHDHPGGSRLGAEAFCQALEQACRQATPVS